MATFGRTEEGGSSVNMNWAGLMGSKAVLTETGVISKISARFRTTDAGGAILTRCVIYSDNAGVPYEPVSVVTDEVSTPINTGVAWVDHVFSTPPTLEPGTYWLFLYAGTNSPYKLYLYYQSGETNGWYNSAAESYPTLPDPWDTSDDTPYNATADIYATYTPDGSFGDTGSASTNDNYAYSEIQLRKFTSFPGGDVASMSLMLRYTGSSGCKVRGVIYSDSAGSPGSCVFTTEEYTIVSGDSSLSFHTLNKYGGGSTSLAAGDYWLGFWVGVSDLYTGDGTTGGTGWYVSGITYSSSATPGSVAGGGAYNRNTRIYLTYTEAASGGDLSFLIARGIGIA